MGSGRACYGMLTITRREIAWMTPFSRCSPSPYRVIDRRDDGEETRVVYQLTRPSATCRYPVLVVTHRAGAGADIGWNVVVTRRPIARRNSAPGTGSAVISTGRQSGNGGRDLPFERSGR